MKTYYDLQQYLKRFGTFIYIGDRLAELELMEAEIREIHRMQMMDTKDYQMAILLIRQQLSLEREKKKKNDKKGENDGKVADGCRFRRYNYQTGSDQFIRRDYS
ncbi:YqgQ family protein [Peribacillus sp. CSMR9]|nr:YqgQ family protein [Peribacillus sp. CSMR9]